MEQQVPNNNPEQTIFIQPLDVQFTQQISSKANKLRSILSNLSMQMRLNNFGADIKKMVESTTKMMQIISHNLHYLNTTEIFSEDFNKSIHKIDIAYETYINAINSIPDFRNESNLINNIQINIDNFAQSIILFSSIFEEIMTEVSTTTDTELVSTRLGLESALFNFAVNIEPSTVKPFFKSRFVDIYKCYNEINKITDRLAAIKSVCGTGKTLCLPLILLCRSLRDKMAVPFLIITQPSPKHVEYKENFFNQTVSKYVTVLSDPDRLQEMYNDYWKTRKISKLALAVLTPHNLLPLMFALRKNPHFYPRTRILVDEIHQRTFHLDVLISKIALFDQSLKLFTLPLSVILMSASISDSLLKPFNGQLKVTTLIQKPPFEIIEKPPIIESNIQRINNELMRDQTVMAIQEMAKFNSKIEEGHILCFLSGIGICHKLKNSVMSVLKHTEETQYQRKIVILQTELRPNESTESYFRRLREEYLFNECLREGKNYKNNFLYIVPLILSGLVEDAIYELSQNEFPDDLKNINKLICSTPMIESSFTIDRLSVVVDSGLFKETEFDRKTCLTTLTEKQTSLESMEQRKGRLGRTMKGMYISIHAPYSQVPMIQIPPIQRLDLSTNILLMKDICINFESMDNLPTPPNQDNLVFAMNTLKYIGAIDSKTLKITPFGHELLNYPFISIFYAAAILKFRDRFFKPEQMQANFIGAYVATLITMDTLLVQEDMTEKMSRFFKADSDITSLINPLNQLLRCPITDNDKLRDIVESYGFSYSQFLVFKNHLQEIVNITFPGQTVYSVIGSIGGFVKKYGGITGLVDLFIGYIEMVYPKWQQIHTIKFKHVVGVGGFDSRPTIVFAGDKNLMFDGQRQDSSEVRISKRPGWNGITIPTECYCFNITRNSNAKLNYGRLIHRKSASIFSTAIDSIECDKIALNPWFYVLIDSYFKGIDLAVTPFTNVTVRSNNQTSVETKKFHYSNAGERVFISFIPKDPFVQITITQGINDCLKLLPFTPRSVLIFNTDVQSVIEATSIGAQHYESSVVSSSECHILNHNDICWLSSTNGLAKSNSMTRICCLFYYNETNKTGEFDQTQLYVISRAQAYFGQISAKRLLNNRIRELTERRYNNYNSQRYRGYRYTNNFNQLAIFQFPIKFIHPALLYHQQSLDCIMNWFRNFCPYAHIVKVIGHRFLMKQGEIINLQQHLRNDKEKIKKEMNLNYSVIPVSNKVYQKIHNIIRQHSTWFYDSRFKVIIVSKDEIKEVTEIVKTTMDQIEKDKKETNELSESTLGCLYVCDDPDNPILTNSPITVYYKDGTSYTNKMCRDCMADNLSVAVESFYVDGKIDQEALEKISIKPSAIPSVESKEIEGGLECWPIVPLGQLITTLFRNDDELAGLISAWLQGVYEFTIRNLARDKITFCPDHPHRLFELRKNETNLLKCTYRGCENSLCLFCNCWHPISYECEEKKSGIKFEWNKKCPKCNTLTYKDGGCNHITCPCGCHWCYKCGEGFKVASECYAHLSAVHGGCFDYEFDD